MKNLILILALFSLISCKKTDPAQICKTCTVTSVTNTQDIYGLTAIESITEYCNGEADTIKQGMIYWKKVSQNDNFTETTKTRTCK